VDENQKFFGEKVKFGKIFQGVWKMFWK